MLLAPPGLSAPWLPSRSLRLVSDAPWPDDAVGLWLHERAVASPWLVDAGVVADVVLDPWVFRVGVVAAALWVRRRGRRRTGGVVAATMVAGTLLGVALKLVLMRARPVWAQPVAVEAGFSMPSGHALNAALGTGLLLVLAWPRLRRGPEWQRRVAVAAAVVVSALAALDRLVLGVHYLSDVVAGSLLGAGVAAVAAAVAAEVVARGDGPGGGGGRR